MRKRTFTINCTDTSTNSVCYELQMLLIRFIDAAFPPNGSDCAQATRSSLMELANDIKNSTGNCEINTRQRPLLKTAINWYFEEVEPNAKMRERLMILIAKKKK